MNNYYYICIDDWYLISRLGITVFSYKFSSSIGNDGCFVIEGVVIFKHTADSITQDFTAKFIVNPSDEILTICGLYGIEYGILFESGSLKSILCGYDTESFDKALTKFLTSKNIELEECEYL